MARWWALWLVSLLLKIASAALVSYSAGQAVSLLILIYERQELIVRAISRRRTSTAHDNSEESSTAAVPQYRRRQLSPPAPAEPPHVPEDDPRRVRTYTKSVIKTDAPASRIPIPKAKG